MVECQQTIGFQQKPTVKLGKREKAILEFLRTEWKGAQLKAIIESCENVTLRHIPLKKRRRLEAYYLSSLRSLQQKHLVWKTKTVKQEKLFIWPEENLNFQPQLYHVNKRKVTFYGATE